MTGTAGEEECEVAIVGAGPTGLLLACLLAGRGVRVRVIERRPTPPLSSRAIGLHPPALRALAQVGLDREAVALGQRIRVGRALCRRRELGRVDFAGSRPRPGFVLALPQSRTEDLLSERLAELDSSVLRRGWELTALQETTSAVTLTARRSSGRAGTLRLRADLVVGADGPRSRVRELLGIATEGHDYPDAYLMGDLEDPLGEDRERDAVVHLEPEGVVESFPLPGGRRRWVVRTETKAAELTPEQLVALVRERSGTVLDPRTTTMLSSFGVRRRTARRLLSRRCVLLGDAAHEISPIGGQGITLGWLDALDIAPLLARDPVGTQARALWTRALCEDPAWCRAERRIRRRARLAGVIAAANTVLGRPAGPSVASLRGMAVHVLLRTPLRRALAWTYSMGWVRTG